MQFELQDRHNFKFHCELIIRQNSPKFKPNQTSNSQFSILNWSEECYTRPAQYEDQLKSLKVTLKQQPMFM